MPESGEASPGRKSQSQKRALNLGKARRNVKPFACGAIGRWVRCGTGECGEGWGFPLREAENRVYTGDARPYRCGGLTGVVSSASRGGCFAARDSSTADTGAGAHPDRRGKGSVACLRSSGGSKAIPREMSESHATTPDVKAEEAGVEAMEEKSAGRAMRRVLASPVVRGGLSIAVLFILFTLSDWRFRHLPYYWDSLGYVYPHSHEIYSNGLFPILRGWDVGHPTAFFFTLALVMKGFGTGPLAGHLLVWGFSALLLVALYGLGRVLGLPRVVSATGALVMLAYPLLRAMTLQILVDLPMLAVALASYWFWARDRRWGYVLLGSYATLMKLHGVLLVAGPVGAVLFTSGAFWRRGRRGPFLRDMAFAAAPILALVVFMVLRYQVRGSGMTIDWTSGNKLVPVWDWDRFSAYLPTAWYALFPVALTDRLLYSCVAVWIAVGLVAAIQRRRRANGVDRVPVGDSRSRRRLVAALIFNALATTLAFFQSESLTARYVFPTVAALFLLGNLGLWRLFRRPGAVVALHIVIAAVFIILWHPRYGERLPSPLSSWLTRSPVIGQWRYENDLRFLDVIHQMEWAAKKVEKDARERGERAAIATPWPMSVAYGVADIGVVDKPMVSVQINSWDEVDPAKTPYVVFLCPITLFNGPPPSDRFEWENVAIHERGEITAEIWQVRAKNTR